MQILAGTVLGLVAWFLLRVLLMGVYTVDQNERAVKTRFGRAVRVPSGKTTLDDPVAEMLRPEERDRYTYPQVRVIPPGGPYFKMPWEKIYKVSIATMTVNMALDPETPAANDGGTQRDLADSLRLAKPTVSKMLKAMEKAGAIERHPDEHDQRLTRVYLTAVGHKLETELRAVSAAQINETIGSLPEGDRRELGRLLEALSASISAAIDARQRPSA